ncbi:TIGR03364 family FAD-dependent oxidoreductase [Chitinophagaceae bacterium MMS25-I14]
MHKTAIIAGAGIVGLAAARALSLRGYKVKVFERNERATGASVRNFGMIWPVGQPQGALYERAMLSRSIWLEVCSEAGIWNNPCGSLQLAYHDDEMNVLSEFAEINKDVPAFALLDAQTTIARSVSVNPEGLKGALWSSEEVIVDAREAIAKLPAYLAEKYGVEFHFNEVITGISHPRVYTGNDVYEADEIFVCSGADFETLYPEVFTASGITKCKLQMMRSAPYNTDIGAALCGGMTLTHYTAFEACASLPALKERIAGQYPEYVKYGIHVMVSQNGLGELVIGDSHEYGNTHDPFDKHFINKMILDYLATFTQFPGMEIAQTWHGIYPKLKKGTEFIAHPEDGVTIVNGLGGAGMTLSFGLLEQLIGNKILM